MLTEIARLMAARMSYEDPIRIAQLKLAGLADRSRTQPRSVDVRKFRLDELVSALPAVIAEYVLDALEWAGWNQQERQAPLQLGELVRHRPPEDGRGTAPVATVFGALCQGTGLGRALAAHDRPQPDQAARGGVRNRADRDHDRGYGDVYRQGLADWNAIIDGLVKPTFDGVLALPDLGAP